MDCGRYINIAEIEIYVCMDSIHLVKYGKAEKTGLGYTQGVPDTWTDPASIQVGICNVLNRSIPSLSKSSGAAGSISTHFLL